MMANTSKSAADFLIQHRCFAHFNEAFIKELVIITSGIVISLSTNKLLFCSICVKPKITRQPHQQPQTYITILRFQLHVVIGRNRNIYAIFCGYYYFILFVYETTSYIQVRFLKKKSKALVIFQALVTFLKPQYGIQIYIIYINFEEFDFKTASNYFSKTVIIWESYVNSKTRLWKD